MELRFRALMVNILLPAFHRKEWCQEKICFGFTLYRFRFGRRERMIVISFNEEYGKKVTDALHEVKGKEVIQFRMNEPELPVDYKWDMLAFPVMQALGIKAEELQ